MSPETPEIIPNPPETEEPIKPPDEPDPLEKRLYFVLKAGEILGPLTFRKLVTLIAAKEIARDDFAQEAGTHEWVPLAWVLDPARGPREVGATAPAWRTLLAWAWLRLRYNLDEQSLPAGIACLAISIAGLLVSRWPVVFWGPWAIFAFLAGIALYRRGRTLHGIALMLLGPGIPFTLWAVFWL